MHAVSYHILVIRSVVTFLQPNIV